MTKTTRNTVIALVVVIGLGVFYFARPGCACLTPDQAARGLTKSEMRNVLGAIDIWREEHGRFPQTMEELGYAGDTTVARVRLAAVTDSSLTLVGTSVKWTKVTCTLEVTAAVGTMDSTVCSGSADD